MELAIACAHDYMVVVVTVTKMALAITAVPTTLDLTSGFPTTGYARVL